MGARNYDLCGHWRDELVKLETDLKELESQCCPPDDATAKAKTWQPPASGPIRPQIDGGRIASARAGQPLRITARVTDPAGVTSVRVRYRHLTQFEDYAALELKPTGEPGAFAATIPAEAISPKWDFMYFIEAIDAAGQGAIWPDLAKEAPYVIVKVAHP
jgi:hypothetical protein